MADFLAPVTYTAFKSPVPAIDVGVWANIAEMGFKQNMLMQDMLDKSYQSVAAVNPTLNQDKDYVNKKKEELDKKLEAFTNKGPFISPKNMGAIRQLSREYTFDKEFQAINNRTAKIAETNKRINDEKLPMFNYLDFNDSIEKANADYEANKTYNPDVKLNFNITPYSNVMEKMMKVVDNIPEISDARLTTDETGNYMYVRTVSGRSFEHTKAALMASLDTKDYAQLQAEYNGLLRTSPESLIPEKDVLDGNGQVMYKQGEMLTFEQFATNEVLKITAAVTGQSVDIDNLQKSMSAEEYLIKLTAEAKNKGISVSEADMGKRIFETEGTAIGISSKAQLNATIEEVGQLERHVANLETQINNGEGTDLSRAKGELAAAKAELTLKREAIKTTSQNITSAIPQEKLAGLYNGSDRPGTKGNYRHSLGELHTELKRMIDNKELTADEAKEILSLIPFNAADIDAAENFPGFATALMVADLDALHEKLQATSAYKSWDESSYFKGWIAEDVGGDLIGKVFFEAKAAKGVIENKYASSIRKVENAQKQVGTARVLTATQHYDDAEGKSKIHPLYELNETVTKNIQQDADSWIDVYSGRTLGELLKEQPLTMSNTFSNVTDGFVNGHQVVTVTTYSGEKSGDPQKTGTTFHVYNVADPYVDLTLDILQRGGVEYANQFRYDKQILAPLQKMEAAIDALPNVDTASKAIGGNNRAGTLIGQTDAGEPVTLFVYKLSNDNLILGTQTGDNPVKFEDNANGEHITFTSLRHAATYIGKQQDLKKSNQVYSQANYQATNNAVYRVFNNEPDKFKSSLLKVIGFESGGTYSPAKENGMGSGAVGLIQFYFDDNDQMKINKKLPDGTVVERKLNRSTVASMTHEEQTILIKDYMDSNNVSLQTLTTPAEIWLPIFMPVLHRAWQVPANRTKTVKELVGTSLKWSNVVAQNPALELTDKTTLQQLMDFMSKEINKH